MRGKRHFQNIIMLAAISAALCGCGAIGAGNKTASGMNYLESMDYENALPCFDAAISEGEDARQSYRGLGICYLDMGEYEKAVSAFKTALSASNGLVNSMDYDMNYYLAESYMKLEDYADAISTYNAILNLKPGEIDALYLRGTAELKNGDVDSAKADFDKVISLSPKDYDRLILIYQALADNGYADDGSAILQNVMDSGTDSMSNYEKGQISFYLGNNADAQNYLEQARNERGNVDKTPIIILLGQTGEKQGDYNYAISVYRSYLVDNPNHADIYNRLGICEMESGDYTSAVADFESGIALEDSTITQTLLKNEITAYEYSGDFEKAASLADDYLSKYPDDQEMVREKRFLSTRI